MSSTWALVIAFTLLFVGVEAIRAGIKNAHNSKGIRFEQFIKRDVSDVIAN